MNRNSLKKRFDLFRRDLKRSPRDGLLWFRYGRFIDEECDNTVEAVRAFEMARRYLPGKDLRLRLGSAYVKDGQARRGIALIRESLLDRPRAHGYSFLADSYIQLGKFKQAQAACRKALELEPDYEEAFYLMGEAIWPTSREKAIPYFREAIARDKNYQAAWQALGSVLVGDDAARAEGIAALKKALRLKHDDVWARIYLANAYWSLRRYTEAEEQYRASIRISPEFSDVRKWYADFLRSRGRLKEAARQMKQAKKLGWPDDSESQEEPGPDRKNRGRRFTIHKPGHRGRVS